MKKISIQFLSPLLIIILFNSIIFQLQAGSPTPKKVNKPKNIIFLIGDGMGTAQIYAALTIKKDKLNIAKFKHIGFHKTYSAKDYITDSAAGATAFSTGHKTKNGYLAVDTNKKVLPTILELAEQKGLSTGLVVCCAITHATPAAFIAHESDRNDYEDIAPWFLKTDVDVFIGGGKQYFENRKDKRNLSDSLRKRNYQLVYDLNQLQAVTKGKIAAMLYQDHPPSMLGGRGDMLGKSSSKAISVLSQNKKGFFMMIEGSQIDWACHNNSNDTLIGEMLDFDDVVGIALDFAKSNGETLVVVTADHETGGYALTENTLTDGKPSGKFNTKGHTAVMVPVFAYGPGAEEFMGIMENTDIFFKFRKLLFGY
ncbi:MAG: alkaline phosphatase [Bacteroidetes bacterium]|nr:alkaline phosphatase [Bacteroidota bacterium]